MPIYEYRCAACGFQKEYLQRMSDKPLSDCPECGKRDFNKMVTAAGFQLKGSGWYATDFKNGSKPAKVQDKAADGTAKKQDSKESKTADASATRKEDPKESKLKTEAAGSTAASPASN